MLIILVLLAVGSVFASILVIAALMLSSRLSQEEDVVETYEATQQRANGHVPAHRDVPTR